MALFDGVWPSGSKEELFANGCLQAECVVKLSVSLSQRAQFRQRSMCIHKNNNFSSLSQKRG